MALTLGDNFSYLGAKPLDGRVKYDTIAQMAAMSASTLYDGIIAYCVADGKNYQWKSTNDVDATLGKWRELASGGGGQTYNDFTGATSSTAGAHGLVPAPSAGDEDKVLFGNGAWGALPSVDLSMLSNEAFQLTTTEKAIGTYTDSNNVTKILYAKTIKGTSPSNSTDTVIYTFNSDEECVAINGALLSGCVPINYTGSSSSWYSRCYAENSNPDRLHLQVAGYLNTPYSIAVFYTKTTDSPLPSGVKFAGVTSSGEVIYKQTISTTFASGLIHTITDTNIIPYRLQANMHMDNKSVMSDGFIYNTNNYWSIWVDDRKIYGVNGGTSYAGRAIDIDLYYTLAS